MSFITKLIKWKRNHMSKCSQSLKPIKTNAVSRWTFTSKAYLVTWNRYRHSRKQWSLSRAFKTTMVQGSSINTYSFTQLLTVERIPQCEVLELFSWARRDIFSLNSLVTWCKLVSQFIDYLLAKNIFCFLPLLDLFSALYLSFSLRSATSFLGFCISQWSYLWFLPISSSSS